ncbi:hypothetical protein HGRIS_009359 [Hohenbuehelia grisea]|uniref:Uncharacterized protein n=1 Tax=Hohenbuehelia grisea TaxID=104357 RepID=A0ABR3J0V7_9AGAR
MAKSSGVRRACPTCRQTLTTRDGEGQRLHVTFCEQTSVSNVVNTLTSIDETSSVHDVNKARTVYHQFCQNTNRDSETVLQAKEEMETRILHRASMIEQQARDASGLKTTISGLSDQIELLQANMKQMKEELSRKNREIGMLHQQRSTSPVPPAWTPPSIPPSTSILAERQHAGHAPQPQANYYRPPQGHPMQSTSAVSSSTLMNALNPPTRSIQASMPHLPSLINVPARIDPSQLMQRAPPMYTSQRQVSQPTMGRVGVPELFNPAYLNDADPAMFPGVDFESDFSQWFNEASTDVVEG